MMNLGLPAINWRYLPDIRSFSPYRINELHQSYGFTRKHSNITITKEISCQINDMTLTLNNEILLSVSNSSVSDRNN